MRVSVLFGGMAVGEFDAPPAWDDVVVLMPADAVRPGLNALELTYSTTPHDSGLTRRNSVLALDWVRFERTSERRAR